MTTNRPCKDCEGREEIWTPAKHEGYEISSHGRVHSLDRIDRRGRRWKGRYMAQVLPTNRRYLQVGMEAEKGKQVMESVHILVLEHFVCERPPEMLGLHWDDDPEHNHLDNLRWGTHSENSQDCIRNGNHPEARKTQCDYGHRLEHSNLVAASGHRRCRSCRNARQYVRLNPSILFEDKADEYYRRYVGA